MKRFLTLVSRAGQPFPLLILFLGLTISLSIKEKARLWRGAALGGIAAISWFSLSFLVVFQLHLSLGGQL